MKYLKVSLALASLSCLFFLSGCGGDDTSATSSAASSVTISGTMSLTDATTTGIINGHGVLPLAATASADDYKLYCVGFVDPPPSCTMTIKTGVFGSTCGEFADTPFGCFAIDVSNKVSPLVADEGMSSSGGGEIELTVIFDTETGSGTITAQLKKGKKVEVTADQLANLNVWLDGMVYTMGMKGETEKDDVLGLPGTSAIRQAQQGPPGPGPGQGPGGPGKGDEGPKENENVFLKLYQVKDANGALAEELLLVAAEDITDRCEFDETKGEFIYHMSNGTNKVVLDTSTLEAFETSMKNALKGDKRVFSAALEEAIMKVIEARLADRFSQCDQLQNEQNSPISEDKCVFGYPNPSVFANSKPGDFRAFSELKPSDIIKVSASDSAGPGPEKKTYEPAIQRIEYRDKDDKFTDDPSKGVRSFTFPQLLNVWCPDPYRQNALNNFPVRLTSETEILTASQAIARLKTGDDAKRILDDRGCSDTAKNDELRREFGRILAEIFQFLSRFNKSECDRIYDSRQLANIKQQGQAALDQFSKQGPVHKDFQGFKDAKEFDKDKNAPPPGGQPQFGGAPQDQPKDQQQPHGALLFAAQGPSQGQQPQGQGQQQGGYDPGIIDCAKRDGNKNDFSDEDARCYMERFVPPPMAVLCSLDTTLFSELTTIADKSCLPRGIRVEPLCEEADVKVTQDGEGKAQGPAFKGFHCEPQLVLGHLAPAAAHDVMSRQNQVLAPLFGFEAFDGPINRFREDGSGVPKKCTESFGVQMTGKLPKDGDGKTLKITDVIKGRLAFNNKNTCNERSGDVALEGIEESDANREQRFTATPK